MRNGVGAARIGGFAVVVAIAGLGTAGSARAALRAPAPQTPAADITVEALPTFTWRAVKGAAQYEFQLAADRKFTSIVLGTGRGKGSQRTRNTAATLDGSVPDGTYHWRVRAITAKGRSGRWSSPRTMTKDWKVAPALQAPADHSSVEWPKTPLVLRWSPVPHATKYLVTIATDPTLAQSVVGIANKPVETDGTVYTLPTPLSAGRYYWAVTPVDAGGHRGTTSDAREFEWSWPTATTPRIVDVNASDRVFDPLLEWDPIDGAARYEVEINPDDDFSPGAKVCCKERVLGPSLSPLRVLPNNSYHWRVRAYDVDDNPGQWNTGQPFVKTYDDVLPRIPGLKVEMADSADPPASSPIVSWDAVAGAAQYQVQWTTYDAGACGWSNASGPVKTSSLYWTPLAPTAPSIIYPPPTGVPGGIGITTTMRPNGTTVRSGQPFTAERAYGTPPVIGFFSGADYCVRVRALSDDSFRENDNATSQVISEWTYVNGAANVPAFTYGGPPDRNTDPLLEQLPAPTYLSPVGGQTVTRTPLLRWSPVAKARRYFVLIARDSNFTNVIDAAFTVMPAYAPNLALEDEETSYFWAVIPSIRSDGSGINGGPKDYNPQSFRKLSVAPTLLSPGEGGTVEDQPTFRWTPTESAQKYRIQVSTDKNFGTLLDDVVTASTAYTSQAPYPADTALYWRVRAEQLQALQSGTERVELRWSTPGTFRRTLPVPAAAVDNPTSGELIPAFAWATVRGAVSYDLHVDEADGDATDFNVKTTAFAPTRFFGTGVFRYKVRANFATRSGSTSSAYSTGQAFTRLISPPPAVQVRKTKTRLTFGWGPAAAASKYLVEVSRSDSFATILDAVRTANTSWAPDLLKPGYANAGGLYWRVATIDEGNNVGAYASGAVGIKRLSVTVAGRPKRNLIRRVFVTVRYRGRRVRGATVRASGAGVRVQAKRTGSRGTARLTLRPRRSGNVTLTVSGSGYETKRVTLTVR